LKILIAKCNFLFENNNRQMQKNSFENNNRQMEKNCLKILIAIIGFLLKILDWKSGLKPITNGLRNSVKGDGCYSEQTGLFSDDADG
jgi:hypothetical protein